METASVACANCNTTFDILAEDFDFYSKIQVPPPTLCPECRLKRRLSWRNDWHLFKKTDERTGEKIFSLYPEESPVKIYDKEYWMSDAWDPMDHGRDFDFNRPFFEQWQELFHSVPLPAHPIMNAVNSQYCTNANDIKNCYLVRGASFTEDSAYVIWDQGSKQCFDSHMTNRCELSYGNINTIECYRTFFSVDCEKCHEMTLSKDCVGCNDCFGSIGLRSKSYHIFNQPYSKEEYFAKIAEMNLGSRKSFDTAREEAYKHWKTFPHKFMHGGQNVNVSGDYIYESKNAKDCYRVRGTEDSKYIQNILTGPVKDCYDYSNYGDNAELVYESMVMGTGVSNVKFCAEGYPNASFMEYSVHCSNASYLFGCVSLRNKKYCILNKQYSKEEYEALVPKIIEHMETTGEYGEFFPSSMSPFPYYATQAHEFFPLTETEATEKGLVWYPIAKQQYTITIPAENLADNIQDADKTILDQVIECAHKESCTHECTGAFRMIETEFDFCKRMNIPLPNLCPNCRHYERLALRNVPKLHTRTCSCDISGHSHSGACSNTFETTYSPNRPEKVYCEQCYQKEIL